MGGIPAPSQDSSVAGGGIPLLRSVYIVHDFTASVKQFLPIVAIVDCDGTPPAERDRGDRGPWLVLRGRRRPANRAVEHLGAREEARARARLRARRPFDGPADRGRRDSSSPARGEYRRSSTRCSSDVVALTHEVAGTVRIGIIGTTARWLVPQLLRTAPQRYPHLRLVFVELTTTRLDCPARNRSRSTSPCSTSRRRGTDLALTPLFEEDLVLVVPADHPLADSREVSLSALKGIPLLLPVAGTAFRADLDAAINSTGATLLARAEIDGTRLIASLTFEGWGPSILPATAVPSYLRDNFALVKLSEIPRRLIGVVQRATGLPSAPARAVLDLLTEIVSRSLQDSRGLDPGAVPATAPRSGVVQL